jgi:hypothetical protein
MLMLARAYITAAAIILLVFSGQLMRDSVLAGVLFIILGVVILMMPAGYSEMVIKTQRGHLDRLRGKQRSIAQGMRHIAKDRLEVRQRTILIDLAEQLEDL